MGIDATWMKQGMDVYGWDGARFGTVTRIWVDRLLDGPADMETSGYFEVHMDDTVQTEPQTLRVPFSAILECVPGRWVTLDFVYRRGTPSYRSLQASRAW